MTNKTDSLCPLRRGRGRPSRDAAAVSREDLARAAFRSFALHGYEGVSLRQLAQDCGVSDSLLHHHFGSKQQLWFAAADSMFIPLVQRLLAQMDALRQAGDLAFVMQHNLPSALKLMTQEPLALQFMFREGEGDHERGEYLREKFIYPYIEHIDAMCQQAQQEGLFRVVSAPARHAMVFGLLRSLALPGMLRGELAPPLQTASSTEAYIDEAVSIFFHGLSRH